MMTKSKNHNHENGAAGPTLLKPMTDLLVTPFGLQKGLGGPVLDAWPSAGGDLSAAEEATTLGIFFNFQATRVRDWGEEVLKSKLLAPLFQLGRFETDCLDFEELETIGLT